MTSELWKLYTELSHLYFYIYTYIHSYQKMYTQAKNVMNKNPD